ncbi:porin [Acidovorax cavernicola]|uniref:Porin n=1 Tax=Acidovorax cavernicola TaxID=1675792 RepID=A0A9X8GWE4_9BURK|nr:porin [Acidovorax cavernicola]RIX82060.1 porin [Acidovorax cavernicola]
MHNHWHSLFLLLISLASLLIGPSSWAQSSVTLYGVVDVSVSHYQTRSRLRAGQPSALPVAPFAAPGTISQSATKLASGAHTPSLLGFRGQEDLGGGWAAGFWLESTLTPDDGAQALGAFDRRSTVSLSGSVGELRLGRDYVPTYWNLTVFDPFGTVGVGANLWNPIGTGLTTSHGKSPANLMPFDNYVRASNSVGYFLPGNLGGFYGQVMYSLHESPKQSGVSHSPSKGGRNVGGRFGYQHGPLNLAIAYQEDTKDDLGGFDKDRLKILNAGVSYDFNVVKLFGQLSQIRDERSKMDVAHLGGIPYPFRNESNGKYTGGLIGITAPVGPGLIRASYSRVNYAAPRAVNALNPATWLQDNDARIEKFAVGYVHNLSKRTALYATIARTRFKWNGALNAPMAISPGGGVRFATGIPGTSAAYAPSSSTGYDLGIRHAF